MNKPWITISVVLGIVMMLIVGVLVMYHTQAFWGLESNSNANTMNTTMNVLCGFSFYPLIVIVVVGLLACVLFLGTARGFE